MFPSTKYKSEISRDKLEKEFKISGLITEQKPKSVLDEMAQELINREYCSPIIRDNYTNKLKNNTYHHSIVSAQADDMDSQISSLAEDLCDSHYNDLFVQYARRLINQFDFIANKNRRRINEIFCALCWSIYTITYRDKAPFLLHPDFITFMDLIDVRYISEKYVSKIKPLFQMLIQYKSFIDEEKDPLYLMKYSALVQRWADKFGYKNITHQGALDDLMEHDIPVCTMTDTLVANLTRPSYTTTPSSDARSSSAYGFFLDNEVSSQVKKNLPTEKMDAGDVVTCSVV